MSHLTDHTAVDSTLGFAHQALQALLLLFRAEDEASVSIEVLDDIAIHHVAGTTQYQVAHTLKTDIPAIELSDAKFWKTIGIWIGQFQENTEYVFITCAPLSPALSCLTSDSDRTALTSSLLGEANKVLQEKADKKHEHKVRYTPCKAYVELSPERRTTLLKAIRIYASTPNILETDTLLAKHLYIFTPEIRQALTLRVRQFWLNRVVGALTGELPNRISRAELLSYLEEVAASLIGGSLPADFSDAEPPTESLAPTNIRRQITLVKGGSHRIRRAQIAHWRSQNQRHKWMVDNITFSPALKKFDDRLREAWQDRHGPMTDDCVSETSTVKEKRGCDLLDWTHLSAPEDLLSVGSKVAPPYVVQGSFQELADRKLIGWHPEFESLLKDDHDEII